MKEIRQPYLLFLGDAPDRLAAKTAIGVYDWRPGACVGQFRLPGCAPDLGIEDLGIAEAANRGALTLMVGVVNRGGVVPDNWLEPMLAALEAGMDIASGLHTRLGSIPALADAATRLGRELIDARIPRDSYPIATGAPRPGHRLLTVGTDCSVGKMYTSLAIEAEMKARGWKADFRATGQTGIFIAGGGVPVDAVVSDFISGSVEQLCPANDPEHWDIVEGQGSLFHPSFAGVSLGLLHGAQPDCLVLCHEPTRTHMRGLPHQPLPGIQECIETNLKAARLVSDNPRFVGISVNSFHVEPGERENLLSRLEDEFGMPCVDPMVTGVAALVDNIEV
ncbi:MAG: DUF1611 domain-containing protein [Proteobacteria bacterium]|nr:MAG: DUF1611 domain-containing protein [Pseudomonadota bacterium]